MSNTETRVINLETRVKNLEDKLKEVGEIILGIPSSSTAYEILMALELISKLLLGDTEKGET